MIINIGSTNQVKVNALKETLVNYNKFKESKVLSLSVKSNVDEQPKSMDETIKGAINRAKASFKGCDLSFGIEDGLMEVPYTKSNYMNICVCAIYDGEEIHLGTSGLHEYPKEITELIFEKNYDLNQAFLEKGLTDKPRIGSEEGAIGIISKGILPRKEYTKQAIVMALIHIN